MEIRFEIYLDTCAMPAGMLADVKGFGAIVRADRALKS